MPTNDYVLPSDIRCFDFFFLDIKWVQQKMEEQHENKLQALEVSSIVLICSVLLSTDGCVYN